MKLGLNLGYTSKRVAAPIEFVRQAEQLGYDSVWSAEAYGGDAVTLAAWVLAQTYTIKAGTAIMQIPGRTPACAAMTAMSLAQLSGGRFIMGLGASGPQVVEGWHGLPYRRAVTRTREYVQIVRRIMAREAPLEFDGTFYQLPFRGAGSTGLGKPLKTLLDAADGVPIYLASITPAGLTCAGEVADGVFPIWMNPERFDVLQPSLQKGFAKVSGKGLQDFDVAPNVMVCLGDDVHACRRPVKEALALYIGGMGARSKNFYTDYAVRLGYEDAALRIQDLYLNGRKAEAAAAVPDALVDDTALVGPRARITDYAQRWQAAAARGEVGTMLIGTRQPEALPMLAEIFL